MRAVFTMPADELEVHMNFTYGYVDDPDNEQLLGNITWHIPDPKKPAHWVHSEDSCKCTICFGTKEVLLIILNRDTLLHFTE